MALNVKLLKSVLKFIEENPSSWDQNRWHCGTTACFAGHACAISGFRFVPSIDVDAAKAKIKTQMPLLTEEEVEAVVSVRAVASSEMVTDGKREFSIPAAAKRVLGLTDKQAQVLFDGDNSLGDLEAVVRALIKNPKAKYEDLHALRSGDEYDYGLSTISVCDSLVRERHEEMLNS